jgi:preprotein translocase subunit SecD
LWEYVKGAAEAFVDNNDEQTGTSNSIPAVTPSNTTIVFEAGVDVATSADMNAAVSIIRERFARHGINSAVVEQESGNRIRVTIPSYTNIDSENIVRIIGKTALLTFRDENGNTLLTGAEVKEANTADYTASAYSDTEYCVNIQFTEYGAELFEEATRNNIGKPIFIYLDGDLLSAPTVNNAITGGSAVITGNFTKENADNLASLIQSGALPFELLVISVS